jgi:tyrosyl-tRNA synthetase
MDKSTKIKELLNRGVQEVIVKEELEAKLKSGQKLRVKLGVDPTSPLLHLGHTVVLRKLKQFQDLGHQVIFLIGDFTARVGDPTDKQAARKPLGEKEIEKNIATYKEQVGRILDLSKVEMRHNLEWYGEMDLAELIQLLSLFSANQMLERDMFQKRLNQKKPVWIHELIYPVLQGYDSVALRSDVELGGTDQTFNMLTARTVQPSYSQKAQDIMTVKILEGTDGKEKMSKSLGNTINLDDSPDDMYGKTMSIHDGLIMKYFELLTDVPLEEIAQYERAISGGVNPKNYKSRLAKEVVAMYHGSQAAERADKEFTKVFSEKGSPSQIPEYKLKKEGKFSILDIITETKCAPSKSEARRLVEQGGVVFNDEIVKNWRQEVEVKSGVLLKVGKRKFVRLIK